MVTMIHYDLTCDKGHPFDGWFQSAKAYDNQRKRKLVTCPACGSAKISKQMMAPGIPTKGNKKAEPAPARMMSGVTDPRQQMILKMMRELRQEVERTADYVGDRFAEEARRMHYNEIEKRGIYGEATADDAKELLEEGVEVHPLPILPEDGN